MGGAFRVHEASESDEPRTIRAYVAFAPDANAISEPHHAFAPEEIRVSPVRDPVTARAEATNRRFVTSESDADGPSRGFVASDWRS